MDDVHPRRARPADADDLLALWLALLSEQAGLDDRFAPSEDAGRRWRNDFPEWLRDAGRFLVVLEQGGALAGFAAAHRWQPPPIYAAVEEVYLDELYVVPAARGCGYGRCLVEAVGAWAASGGAERLRLGVLAANTDGRLFWERLGARPLALTCTLDVEPAPAAPSAAPAPRFGF